MKTIIQTWLRLAVTSALVLVIGSSCGCQTNHQHSDSELNILFTVKMINRYDVYRLRTEGVYPDSVAVMDGDVVQPIWSPDRSKFVFSYFRNEHFDIAIADADGSNLRFLTADSANNFNIASWFPSGDKIVFSSDRLGNPDIFSINLDGTGLTPLVTDSAKDWHPIITPNGKEMLFVSDRTGRPRIWSLNFADSTQRLYLPVDTLCADFEPCLSADGRYLAYTRMIFGKEKPNSEITLFDLVAGRRHTIASDPATDRWPRISMNGNLILFHSDRSGTNALYVYDIKRKTTRALNTGTINSSYGDW